jgi:hypothetical protein
MHLQDRTDLMTPLHPRWAEFTERLHGALTPWLHTDTGHESWNCTTDFDRPLATELLTRMAGIDVAASLEYLAFHAGACDCTIILKVEAAVAQQQEVDDAPFEAYLQQLRDANRK